MAVVNGLTMTEDYRQQYLERDGRFGTAQCSNKKL